MLLWQANSCRWWSSRECGSVSEVSHRAHYSTLAIYCTAVWQSAKLEHSVDIDTLLTLRDDCVETLWSKIIDGSQDGIDSGLFVERTLSSKCMRDTSHCILITIPLSALFRCGRGDTTATPNCTRSTSITTSTSSVAASGQA